MQIFAGMCFRNLFQREAIIQMRKITEYAVETQKQRLLHFIDRIDNEIITFYHRHLTKINATDAEFL
jgi:hypothetical protein